MKCPKCKKEIDISNPESLQNGCPHCYFYLYLNNILNIGCLAVIQIEKNQDIYFSNLHQRIYDPFIREGSNEGDVVQGAIAIGEYLINQFSRVIKGYPREDLLFMAVGLREFAIWETFSPNPWASSRLRNVSHVFVNLINSLPEEAFGDLGIQQFEDLISAFVLVEEIDKIISNVYGTRHFHWNPTLEKIIKTRIENEVFEEFFQQFEERDVEKPEEVEFSVPQIIRYLEQRNMLINQIKHQLITEMETLFGFSIRDLEELRQEIIQIAERNGQIFNVLPIDKDTSIKIVFAFEEQLQVIKPNKFEKIYQRVGYFPTFLKGKTYEELVDPHLDYRFIFKYENIIAFGLLDSANSITMLENIVSSDHFIKEIFGEDASKPFKKAQEKISTLMAMKIAEKFLVKSNYYVPKIEEKVPYVNIKVIQGNGVRINLTNDKNQDLGDIDCLVVNEERGRIYIFEIKYYKPPVNLQASVFKDKKILKDIEKIKAREQWLQDNINLVIKAWDLKRNIYDVETIIVTARPNFYGKELEEYKIRYMPYATALCFSD